ncbi:hypothetical protein DPMN_089638 [Dreissena polymorpha]|uniref:WSC domain-containing protein n=1 Tax=Dreissena polymorpha TaxID=45954 RepID=A0A9D4QYA1_DREPO|nr:hypothetical protein DPMN_089638 [Dreissena polymorpha]
MIRPDSECNSVCPGDSSNKCGAPARIGVYSNVHCGNMLYLYYTPLRYVAVGVF